MRPRGFSDKSHFVRVQEDIEPVTVTPVKITGFFPFQNVHPEGICKAHRKLLVDNLKLPCQIIHDHTDREKVA